MSDKWPLLRAKDDAHQENKKRKRVNKSMRYLDGLSFSAGLIGAALLAQGRPAGIDPRGFRGSSG